VSDIDLLIVGNKENDTQEKLIKLQEKLGEKYDIKFITPKNLSNDFVSLCPDREYTLHGLDIYRLKNQNKVIYGDADILKSVPDISFEEALKDILPYVKGKIIPKLKEKLEDAEDMNTFLLQEFGQFLVVVRTMYSVETNSMTSKLASLDYMKEKHPEFSYLMYALKKCYLGEKFEVLVKKEDMNEMLNQADHLFAEYLNEK
jgi:predicted nucleotidyltransferase